MLLTQSCGSEKIDFLSADAIPLRPDSVGDASLRGLLQRHQWQLWDTPTVLTGLKHFVSLERRLQMMDCDGRAALVDRT